MKVFGTTALALEIEESVIKTKSAIARFILLQPSALLVKINIPLPTPYA